jgi:hypothetical protein
VQFSGTNAVQLAITTAAHAAVVAEKQFFIGTAFGQMRCGFRKRITAAGLYSGYELHAKTGSSTYALVASTGMPAASALVRQA